MPCTTRTYGSRPSPGTLGSGSMRMRNKKLGHHNHTTRSPPRTHPVKQLVSSGSLDVYLSVLDALSKRFRDHAMLFPCCDTYMYPGPDARPLFLDFDVPSPSLDFAVYVYYVKFFCVYMGFVLTNAYYLTRPWFEVRVRRVRLVSNLNGSITRPTIAFRCPLV